MSKNGMLIDEITPKEGVYTRVVVPEAEADRARKIIDKFLMAAEEEND